METVALHLQHALNHSWVLAVALAFLGGALTGFNPCTYPTIPVVLGLIGGQGKQTRWRGLAVAACFVCGLATTYVLIGMFASFVGRKFGLSDRAWATIVAAVCVVVGLGLAGAYRLEWRTLAPLQSRWMELGGWFGTFALGMLFGLVASPCATPILVVIIAFAASKGAVLFGGLLLFVYATGHGLPLLILGAGASALKTSPAMQRHGSVVRRVSGVLIVVMGLYLAWVARGLA